MAGIDPTRDADYLRLKFRDIVTRVSDLESGKTLSLVAESFTTAYTVIRTGMFIPTVEDVAGGGLILPGGFFWAEGSEVSRVAYVALWTMLGQPDTGDGDTTFNLPDTTGRAPFGVGTGITLGQGSGSGASHGHTYNIPTGGSHGHGQMEQAPVQRTATGQDTAGAGHTHGNAGDHAHGGGGSTGNAAVGSFGVKWLVKI